MQFFTERRLQADFHFSLNVNVNVTVVSYMNSASRETILHNFLQQWIDLNIFRTMKPESTSKGALFKTINLAHKSCFLLYTSSMYF